MTIVHNYLVEIFYFLGTEIGRQPKLFLMLSFFTSLAFSTGIFNLKFNSDTEYLFTVSNSATKNARNMIEKYFPTNYSFFDPSRMTRSGRFASLIVAPRSEDGLTHVCFWEEMSELDTAMHNISIIVGGQSFNYSQLCAKSQEECIENGILELWPILKNANNTIIVNQVNKSMNALMLKYFISIQSWEDNERGGIWEDSVIKMLNDMDSLWECIKIFRLTSQTLLEEPQTNTFSVIPHISVTIALIFIFTMITCMNSDWEKVGALVGFMGIVSSILGASAACGLLGFLQVDFIGLNIAIPFITLGIGLDDTFILLASWRKVSSENSVPRKLALCFSESAVSISITTLTDMLSFYVGVLSPIPSIRIFSIYAGSCIAFIYVWHIFFFGSVLALHGYRKANNERFISDWTNSDRNEKSCFASKPTFPEHSSIKQTAKNWVVDFFQETFATFISQNSTKASIMAVYAVYIITALFGLMELKDGLLRENLARYDSYMSDYFIHERKYFSNYPRWIQVVITQPLDYHNKSVQSDVEQFLHDFTELDHITSNFSESWLRDFSTHNDEGGGEKNNTEFITAWRNEFCRYDKQKTCRDVALNSDGTEIRASRFIIQSENVDDLNAEKNLYKDLQKIAGKYEGFHAVIYHPYFDFVELHIITMELTVKLVILASVIVMCVSLLLIPNVMGSLCVFLSISSVELGVLGFMSLWSIRLDLISLICLIMCIGFSVDFSAHVAYTYIICGKSCTNRLRYTMHSLGLPIIQGAISTLIGVSALVFVPSYIFQCFFKIVFLVMVFSVFHALFVIPILLESVLHVKSYLETKIYQVNM